MKKYKQSLKPRELGYNEVRTRNGKADDIVINGVDLHLEDMDGKSWWLGVYRGKKYATFWIKSKNKISVKLEENELGLKLKPSKSKLS